ncbi:MAG: hypothetical protein K0Q49_1968 [Haloplasmataceae bacterium]|jgi:hypothetical protein|nr:hypothetical protein [Haloplasmataceae bacterium]
MKVKKLDSLGKAGVIVNLVFFGLEILAALSMLISGIGDLTDIRFLSIFGALLLGSLTIVATLFNAKVLNGELRYKTLASVLGFVCLSVLGSILLIVSKDEAIEDHLADTLTKLKALLDAGAITEVEFNALKNNLIK